MEKAYDKHDLNRFFSHIKSKYEIPRPDTNITGKVTCRNGHEYIEKPFHHNREIDEIRQESRLKRQQKYVACGHYSSVTNPYRSLGEIILDPKRLTMKNFNTNETQETIAHINKWRNATKVVFPAVRMHRRFSFTDSNSCDEQSSQSTTGSKARRKKHNFVVQHKDWPKIESTGYTQLAEGVSVTNKRVAATRGMTPYFRVLETDQLENSLDGGSHDSGLLDDSSITKPANAIDGIKREKVIKRLEAFVYVFTSLFNIKNRDLKMKHPIRLDSSNNVPDNVRPSVIPEMPPIKGFVWNEGIPPWQKIKQENEFLASLEKENADKSSEAKDQVFLSKLRQDFVALQEKLDSHVSYRLRRFFRDDKEKFIRRFHALKHAPTLSLGMEEVRRVERTSKTVDTENKSSSKQDWYVTALDQLEIKRYISDNQVVPLLEQFERFSHSDITEEIKMLKAKLCYLTLSMPVYYVLQPDYQYAIRFVIQWCLGAQEDLFGSWFKLRFKKPRLTAQT